MAKRVSIAEARRNAMGTMKNAEAKRINRVEKEAAAERALEVTEVYVVTSGIFEGYHIDAIFDDEQLAETYISIYGKKSGPEDMGIEYMGIEVWEINSSEPPRKDDHG